MALAILAIDAATSTGWALLDRRGVVTSGVQRFDLGRGESPGMRFLRFRRWLREVCHTTSTRTVAGRNEYETEEEVVHHKAVDLISFEQGSHGVRGGAATQVLVGLQAVILEEAASLGIETLPANTSTVKKHATGKGNAKKPAMVAAGKALALRFYGPSYGTDAMGDDEADALCMLAWAMEQVGAREGEGS